MLELSLRSWCLQGLACVPASPTGDEFFPPHSDSLIASASVTITVSPTDITVRLLFLRRNSSWLTLDTETPADCNPPRSWFHFCCYDKISPTKRNAGDKGFIWLIVPARSQSLQGSATGTRDRESQHIQEWREGECLHGWCSASFSAFAVQDQHQGDSTTHF